MTLTLAWWIHEQLPDHPVVGAVSAVPLVGVAGSPYDVFTRATNSLDSFNRRVAGQATAKAQHRYMVKSGMTISRSSAKHFAAAGVGRLSSRMALRVGARIGARLVPGLGWALLAYDIYTVAGMIADS